MDALNSTGNLAKKFFDKPEGKVGMVVIALLIGAGLVGLYYLLPFIIILLQNTLHAMFLIAGVALFLFIVTNKKVQMLASYAFKSIMRAFTGFFINIDPIGITKEYILRLRKNRASMDKHLGKLKGQINSLKIAIKKNTKDITNNLKLASAAKAQNKVMMVRSKTRMAKRRESSNIEFKDMLIKMEGLYAIIVKIAEVTDFVIDDMEDDLDTRIRKYKTIRSAHGAFSSAMSVIEGNPDERAMFEQALEHMENDVANKVGEMERFIEMSATVIDSVDLQNGIYEEEGMALLEKFETKGLDMLLGELETLPSGKTVSRSNVDTNSLRPPAFSVSEKMHNDVTIEGKYFDWN